MRFEVELSEEQIAAIYWFITHLGFEHYSDRVPPHLGKEVVTDKAYEMQEAVVSLNDQLPKCKTRSWMYRT